MSTNGTLDEVHTDTEGLKVFPGRYNSYSVTYKGFQYRPASIGRNKQIVRCSKIHSSCRCRGRLYLSLDFKKVLCEETEHNHDADPVECTRRYEQWLANKMYIPKSTETTSVAPAPKNKKRAKPTVWSDEEITDLVNFVARQYKFLFGDYRNKARLKAIEDSWSNITEQLNAAYGQNRNMRQVKDEYADLKGRAKLKAAKCLKRIMNTTDVELEDDQIRAALSTATTSFKGYEKTLISDIGYSAILKTAQSLMNPGSKNNDANKTEVLNVPENDDNQACSPAKKHCPSSNLEEQMPSFGEQYGREALQLINRVFAAYKLPVQCCAPGALNFEAIVKMNPDLHRFFNMNNEGTCSLNYDTSKFTRTGLDISQMLKKESVNWPPFIWINVEGPAVPTMAPVENLTLKRPNGNSCEFVLHGIVTRINESVYEALLRGDSGNFVTFEGISTNGTELVHCLSKGSAASFLYGFIDKGVLAEPSPAESKILNRSAVDNRKIKEIWEKDELLEIKIKNEKRAVPELPEKLTLIQKKAIELLNLKTPHKFSLTDEQSQTLAGFVNRRTTNKSQQMFYFSDGRFYDKYIGLLCQECLGRIRFKRDKGPAYCSNHEPNRSDLHYAVLLLRPTFNTAIATPVVEVAGKDREFEINTIRNSRNRIISNKNRVPSELVPDHTTIFDSLLEAQSYLRGLTVCNIFHSIFGRTPMHDRYHLGAHHYEFVCPSLEKICKQFGILIELGNEDHSQNLSLEMAQKYGLIFPAYGTYDKVPLVYTRVHEIDHTKRLIYVGKNSNPRSYVSNKCGYIEPRKVLETTAVLLTPYKRLLPTLESATQVAYVLAMCLGVKKNGHEIIFQNCFLEVQMASFEDTSFLDYVKLIFLHEFNYNIVIQKLE